ncbi:Protein MMS22-like [Acipenser ruthenus]|uniref:Protein MMS22-like n=1 Tax=Acipenser ruthenus TaxID=7906 RepID=A0A444TY90_ACIRT|nr:Protein MMS22-like [Acipenser ruthenus]
MENEDFSPSLTPPISPYIEESLSELSHSKPPLFCCVSDHSRDGGRLFSPDGYIGRGSLKRLLLRLDPSPTDYETDTVDLFGFPWVTETALVESTKLLFGLFRYLEPSRGMDNGTVHPYEKLEAELPSVLLGELHATVLYIGKLQDLPSNIHGAFSIQNQGKLLPPSWHLLHLHLDIHWSILEILHLLGEKMLGQVVYAHQFMNQTGENLTNISLFEEHCTHLLCDLVGFAINKYTKFFWSYVNKLLRILLEGTHVDKTRQHFTAHCKDPLGFSWWLVTHLAELYQYSRNGAVEGKNNAFTIPWLGLKGLMSVSKTPFSMLELVKSCCSEQQSPDLYRMANSFQIFLRIVALQMNKETTGTHPWKQIKGRVYSKFHQRKMQELSEAGLMNFLSLFLVLAATAEVEDVVSRVSDLLGLLNPSSISTTQKALIWRGLFAFILLYEEKGLDIGVLADQLSVAFQQAAKEFYLKTTDNTRKLTLWTLLSTYIEGVQEVFETSSYLHLSEEKLLNEGFVMLLPACRESELHTALGFLQTVLARLRSVYKRSSQSLQQSHTAAAQKAPSPFVAKERHLAIAGALWRNFFHFLKSLRLSQTPPPQLADTAAGFSLLAVDMPSTAPSDLQPQPLLSIMQNFGWDEMLNPQLVSRYLSHLIQNSALVASLSGVGSSSYQALSVRSWFRCVLQHHINVTPNADQTDIGRVAGKGNADQLSELTRLVFKLPEMEMLLLKAQIEQSAVKVEPRPALSLFIKAVGRAYAGLQTLAEKSAMVSKALEYAGDILKYIKPYLVNKGPPEGLQLSYWTVVLIPINIDDTKLKGSDRKIVLNGGLVTSSVSGCLVKHWALILATSKAQQLLFRIIDCLLLPHALFQQDKGIPSPMLSVLRDNLPLFLQGLSVISTVSQTQGAYLKQQLRNIIQQYFGRFLPASPSLSAIVNHPILLALCESSSSPRTAQLRRTVLQVITDGYMQFKGHAPPPRLASILSFLHEVLRRSDDSDLTSYTEPLPAVLKCLVLVNEPQVKRLSTETLQLVVEHCQAVARGGPCTQLSSVLRQFVEEHMGVYDLQVYNVLEIVAVLEQSIVIGLIPTTSRCLRDTEHKRGLGKNTSQRNAYKRLLSHLGDEGQAEILNLDNE